MKNKIKPVVIFFIGALFLTTFSSCEKENDTPCNQGGTSQIMQEQTN